MRFFLNRMLKKDSKAVKKDIKVLFLIFAFGFFCIFFFH